MEGKIDRLYVISHAGKRRLKSLRFRYLSKSIIANCKGDENSFEYVNFRGAHFSRSSFKGSVFKGCDFWGTTFKKCKFNNAVFEDCVFQGCRFKNCDFSGAQVRYSCIVNTNTEECRDLNIDDSTLVLKKYPEVDIQKSLLTPLERQKENKYLRKTKVLWISDKRLNYLNLFLLLRKYSSEQIEAYLSQINNRKARLLTTYGSLNSGLRKYVKSSIITKSRPTQSRGCDANGLGFKDWGL